MARNDALNGALPILVLKILDRRGPMHGYGITSHIESASDHLRVEEGSLYPALHRLEAAKLVRAKWAITENNRRARMYEITAAGRRQLAADEKRWKVVMLALHTVLEQI
jgi:PadR family transcriptional regulator